MPPTPRRAPPSRPLTTLLCPSPPAPPRARGARRSRDAAAAARCGRAPRGRSTSSARLPPLTAAGARAMAPGADRREEGKPPLPESHGWAPCPAAYPSATARRPLPHPGVGFVVGGAVVEGKAKRAGGSGGSLGVVGTDRDRQTDRQTSLVLCMFCF